MTVRGAAMWATGIVFALAILVGYMASFGILATHGHEVWATVLAVAGVWLVFFVAAWFL